MTLYCKIDKDGKVEKGPQALPKVDKHTSGLHLLDDPALKKKGWLPLVVDKPAYNPVTQYLKVKPLRVETDRVVKTFDVIDYTQKELDAIAAEEAAKAKRKAELAEAANQVITGLASKNFADVDAFVDSQVTDLATAKVYLAKLSKIVLALVKRESIRL